MSTIKSSDEHLTINADGSGKDIKFQANGVEKASISSAGAFTSTTIDATKLTGDLPAISGANLTGISAGTTLTGSTNNQVTTVTGANAIAGEAKLQFVPDGESKLQIGNGTAEDAFIKIHGNSQNVYFGLDDSNDKITLGWGSTVGSNVIWTVEGDNSMAFGTYGAGNRFMKFHNDTYVYGPRTGASTTNAVGHVHFMNPNGDVGYISTSGTSTSYNTSSDYRLKENVVDMENATDRVKQLKPKRFNFIADDSVTVDGFLAHEVSDIVPEAITGEKDAVDDDGNIKAQAIDQSKLVPLLVKTIQELEARIAALEA